MSRRRRCLVSESELNRLVAGGLAAWIIVSILGQPLLAGIGILVAAWAGVMLFRVHRASPADLPPKNPNALRLSAPARWSTGIPVLDSREQVKEAPWKQCRADAYDDELNLVITSGTRTFNGMTWKWEDMAFGAGWLCGPMPVPSGQGSSGFYGVRMHQGAQNGVVEIALVSVSSIGPTPTDKRTLELMTQDPHAARWIDFLASKGVTINIRGS